MDTNPQGSGMSTGKLLLIVLGVLLLGAGVWYVSGIGRVRDKVVSTSDGSESRAEDLAADQARLRENDAPETSGASGVSWSFDGTKWSPSDTPPACPDPIVFQPPVDTAKATHILYPGQTRGGNYKPHGGFRFNGSANEAITVSAPMDGVVVNGARYLEGGETQYTFDIIAPCGIMYRMGHFLELAPKFQAIAETFPEAKEDDSRTTFVNPPVSVTAGEPIATAVGVRAGTNTFFDWGVYDLRKKNTVSSDSAWAAKHSDDPQLAPYAVCWFNLLPASNAATVKSLPPGDPESGTTSDYCK